MDAHKQNVWVWHSDKQIPEMIFMSVQILTKCTEDVTNLKRSSLEYDAV